MKKLICFMYKSAKAYSWTIYLCIIKNDRDKQLKGGGIYHFIAQGCKEGAYSHCIFKDSMQLLTFHVSSITISQICTHYLGIIHHNHSDRQLQRGWIRCFLEAAKKVSMLIAYSGDLCYC